LEDVAAHYWPFSPQQTAAAAAAAAAAEVYDTEGRFVPEKFEELFR
jgi:hypothetical protein